jgi:hypothetical protein
LTINLNFNPNLFITNAICKKEALTANLKLKSPLSKDTVCFRGELNTGTVSNLEYKNVLEEPLVSNQRPTFEKDLKCRKLASYDNAKLRIASLSRYLKEDMVGFVVPKYETKGEQKGGYQWFEKGAEYLIRGSRRQTQEEDFKHVAKDLYGLLAIHDDYWKSPEFVDYLSTLEQTPAIKATILAVEELGNAPNISFTSGEKSISTLGYFSPLKFIDKLLEDGCAYTGKSFSYNDRPRRPSIEHIMPESWGGPNDDCNYLLTSAKDNYERGNMSLIKYLKGGSSK